VRTHVQRPGRPFKLPAVNLQESRIKRAALQSDASAGTNGRPLPGGHSSTRLNVKRTLSKTTQCTSTNLKEMRRIE
jgi:hypothetical protein